MHTDAENKKKTRSASQWAQPTGRYDVHREPGCSALATLAERPEPGAWLAVDKFHPCSSVHHPVTHAALRYSSTALLLWFRVEDRYVLSRHRGFNQPVCRDSCVEFFFQPPSCLGYFNLEINGGGALLMGYGKNISNRTLLPVPALEHIRVESTLPATVERERPEPLHWSIACTLPYDVLKAAPLKPAERHRLKPGPDDVWRANFYKCADACSHPHWAAWTDIGEQRNFHQHDKFGTLRFRDSPADDTNSLDP